MKTSPPSGPPQPASRASSLGAAALAPALHRESHESMGGRLRRPGCDERGNRRRRREPAPTTTEPGRGQGVTGWLADRPWVLVAGAFALLIGAWSAFLTLAMLNPVRDVLDNPLPATADVRPGH